MKLEYCILSLILAPLFFACEQQPKTLFTQVDSDRSGVAFNNHVVEDDSFNIMTYEYLYNGGGVAIGDVNNDGLPDIYFTGNSVSNKLYINQGDLQFRDVTEQTGTAGRPCLSKSP